MNDQQAIIHDVNNLIGALGNFIELLGTKFPQILGSDQFIKLQKCADRAIGVLNALSEPHQCGILDVVEIAAGEGVDISEISKTLNAKIKPSQLDRIVRNLVNNARREPSTKNIWISASATPKDILIMVRNDGEEIDPEPMEAIRRGVRSKTSRNGKGIGLLSCNNILKEWGQELIISNAPGDVRFVFIVPRLNGR